MTKRPRRRTVVVGLVIAFGVLMDLNVLGILRYPGGPLREPGADAPLWLDIRPPDQGSNAVGDAAGSWQLVDVPLQFGLLTLSNPSGFDATIEAVTPLDPTAGLVVDAVYVTRPGAKKRDVLAWGTGGVYPPDVALAEDFTTLPAAVVPTGDTGKDEPSVILLIRSSQPGRIGWSALAVDYRIGPFTFRAIHHLALAGCLGPMPSGMACGERDPDPLGEEAEDEGEEE